MPAPFLFVALMLPVMFSVSGALPQETESLPFCLVTHYTDNGYRYAEVASANHLAYARRHGYGQRSFVGRLSGPYMVDEEQGGLDDLWGGGLFWQKLIAIRQTLERGVPSDTGSCRMCDWVMWLDSDAIVTNANMRLEDVLAPIIASEAKQGTGHINKKMSVDIILSQENDHPINSGVFFVRNTPIGKSLIDALLALYPMYKDNNLPDQTALATLAYMVEPWPSSTAVRGVMPSLHPSIRLAQQRTFNAFYNKNRLWEPNVQWQPGDFVAHLAGTVWSEREAMMREILAR